MLITILQMLLGFIHLVNSTASNPILSMPISGLYTSCLIPIIYSHDPQSPQVGKAWIRVLQDAEVVGLLNLLSYAWLVLAIVFSTFPTFVPVTAQNMNCSTVVMIGWVVLGGIYYAVLGRKKFQVPVVDREARSFWAGRCFQRT